MIWISSSLRKRKWLTISSWIRNWDRYLLKRVQHKSFIHDEVLMLQKIKLVRYQVIFSMYWQHKPTFQKLCAQFVIENLHYMYMYHHTSVRWDVEVLDDTAKVQHRWDFTIHTQNLALTCESFIDDDCATIKHNCICFMLFTKGLRYLSETDETQQLSIIS